MKNTKLNPEELNFATLANQISSPMTSLTDYNNHVKGFQLGDMKFYLRKAFRTVQSKLDYKSIGQMSITKSEDSANIFFLVPPIDKGVLLS